MTMYSHLTTYSGTTQDNPDRLMASLGTICQEDTRFSLVAQQLEFGPGDIIEIPTGQLEKQHMYVLMQGRINLICKSPTSRQLVAGTLGPGAIWIQDDLCDHNAPHPLAKAMDAVSVRAVPVDEAQDLIVRYPILSWAMLQTYAQRLTQVEDRLEDIVCKNLPERIAALLLELGNYEEGRIEDCSHQMLADYLGTYRETVSSILREFKHEQLIDLGYRWIRLKDKAGLYEKAGVWDL
ncbi:MAG: Crp/Fnr family transcriptional regulator [Caldilineaceae bacterium]